MKGSTNSNHTGLDVGLDNRTRSRVATNNTRALASRTDNSCDGMTTNSQPRGPASQGPCTVAEPAKTCRIPRPTSIGSWPPCAARSLGNAAYIRYMFGGESVETGRSRVGVVDVVGTITSLSGQLARSAYADFTFSGGPLKAPRIVLDKCAFAYFSALL